MPIQRVTALITMNCERELFGLVPAAQVQAYGLGIADPLKEAGRGLSAGKHRVGDSLVVAGLAGYLPARRPQMKQISFASLTGEALVHICFPESPDRKRLPLGFVL